jgi:hypothetical protein
MMATKEFFKRGMKAFDEGLPCAPMMDPEVMEMLDKLDTPIVESLEEWYNGWTMKNLNSER